MNGAGTLGTHVFLVRSSLLFVRAAQGSAESPFDRIQPIAVARRFPQAKRRCAEDGSLAYTNFTYRAHGATTRLRQRLRLGLCADGAARPLPRTLPAESLYRMLRDRPIAVVGGMSTALLTTGLRMPQVRSAALLHASAAGDAWDRRRLDALRITPLADAAAIGAYFEAKPQ